MATISAVILPAKALKNGKHKVRISVAHNSQTRYILTNIVLDSEKEFKNGAVVKRNDAKLKNLKIRETINKYEQILDELEYIDHYSCSELVQQMQSFESRSNKGTIESVFNEWFECATCKESTLVAYKHVYSSLVTFINKDTHMSRITHATIRQYEKYMLKNNNSCTTIRNRMFFLRMLINYAKNYGYVKYKIDPFAGFSLPGITVRDAWLNVDEIRMIRDHDITKKGKKKARDIFMLSYYLGGVNIADLAKMSFKKGQKNICYERTKTERQQKLNKYVEFEIPKEAWEIINRTADMDGYVLGKKAVDSLTNFVNYNIHLISKELGIKDFIYYSARKSFSQHAFQLGISTSVIDYILGHKLDKGGTSLYHYISVTPEMATEAIRKVIDNLNNG